MTTALCCVCPSHKANTEKLTVLRIATWISVNGLNKISCYALQRVKHITDIWNNNKGLRHIKIKRPHAHHSMKIIDSPACLSGFVNENEFHFLLVCPLYNRPRVTHQKAMGHITPFTLRTLLYVDDNFDLTENKRIITETLRFINDSKRFSWLPRICYVSFLTVCVHHSL